MKILHIGWGFQPYRGGGLIEYAEDLMEIQVAKGYEVSYFCTGRYSIISNVPFMKKWKSPKGYTVYELWNPPIVSGFDMGIKDPMADIRESNTEEHFMNVVKQLQPDVVHVQEFLGIPTAVLAKLKELNIKTLFTIEDYFYLCPTLKLVLPSGHVCRIKGEELGKQCEICCSNSPKNNITYKLSMMYPWIFRTRTFKIYKKIKNKLLSLKPPPPEQSQVVTLDEERMKDFNTRRQFNLEAIKHIDLVIAMSNKVADIFNYYEPLSNMIMLNLTLKHIEDIKPRYMSDVGADKLNFALINALNTPLKGRNLIFELFEMINSSVWKDKLQFLVMGRINNEDVPLLSKYPFVNYVGKFNATDLNSIFDNLKVNVGIVPSVWEEAYGYVGIEFLAKGIPVIGNNIGGIPDYVKTGETGWLNESCDADGLFTIINNIVNEPALITSLNNNIITNRDKYVKDMNVHFNEMDALYNDILKSVPVTNGNGYSYND